MAEVGTDYGSHSGLNHLSGHELLPATCEEQPGREQESPGRHHRNPHSVALALWPGVDLQALFLRLLRLRKEERNKS